MPRSILSRDLLPATIAIFTTIAIVAFESLAVTAALPELTAELGTVRLVPWVITSFLLASAVTTAMAGTFIDALGTSVVFRWSTLGFAGSSLVAALAPSMEVLVIARVFQGASGGAIISVGLAATALVFPRHLIGRALAANSNVFAILGFAGPAIAAAMLQVGSWRWIFLLMPPLCVLALAAGWRTLPGPVEATRPRPDWFSAVLLLLAVGTLLGAVSSLSVGSVVLAAVAVAATLLLWRRLSRHDAPLLDPHFLKDAPYRQLSLVASLTTAAMMGVAAYLPVYVRGVRGGTVGAAAWSVLWLTIGWTFAANIAGRITDRVTPVTVLRIGAASSVLTVGLALAAIGLSAPLPAVFATYFLMGMSVGTVTNTALQQVRIACPDNLAGQATSAHAFTRTVGMSIGAGLAGGVILAVVAATTGTVATVREALSGNGGDLTGPTVAALERGFTVAHAVSLGLVLVAFAAARSLATTD